MLKLEKNDLLEWFQDLYKYKAVIYLFLHWATIY